MPDPNDELPEEILKAIPTQRADVPEPELESEELTVPIEDQLTYLQEHVQHLEFELHNATHLIGAIAACAPEQRVEIPEEALARLEKGTVKIATDEAKRAIVVTYKEG